MHPACRALQLCIHFVAPSNYASSLPHPPAAHQGAYEHNLLAPNCLLALCHPRALPTYSSPIVLSNLMLERLRHRLRSPSNVHVVLCPYCLPLRVVLRSTFCCSSWLSLLPEAKTSKPIPHYYPTSSIIHR